jgi:hypothetical protein
VEGWLGAQARSIGVGRVCRFRWTPCGACVALLDSRKATMSEKPRIVHLFRRQYIGCDYLAGEPCVATAVAVGLPPAVEPWRPVRRKANHTLGRDAPDSAVAAFALPAFSRNDAKGNGGRTRPRVLPTGALAGWRCVAGFTKRCRCLVRLGVLGGAPATARGWRVRSPPKCTIPAQANRPRGQGRPNST